MPQSGRPFKFSFLGIQFSLGKARETSPNLQGILYFFQMSLLEFFLRY